MQQLFEKKKIMLYIAFENGRLSSKEQSIGSKRLIRLLICHICFKPKGNVAITFKNHKSKTVSGIRLPSVETIQRSVRLNLGASDSETADSI